MASKLYSPVLLTTFSANDHRQLALDFLQSPFDFDWQVLAENSPNLTFINKDDEKISIGKVRQLISNLAYSSYRGEKRCYVLLHLDQASIPAQNALLKSLEEPPEDTLIILTASRPNKVLPTIHSRCIVKMVGDENQWKKDDQSVSGSLATLENFLLNPESLYYHQLIDLAQEYKDRSRALELINDLIRLVHQDIKTKSTTKKIARLQHLLDTLDYLEKNVNVRLALEAGLFAIKKSI